MKLPVIISTLNRLELLKQTLKSLRKNSVSELEIIVIDDCSSDETWKFLKSQKDLIIYRFLEKATISQVKNKGFELASESKYVYFSDNDVYFEPEWDLKMIKVLETFPEIGIVGGRKHPHHRFFETRQFGDFNILICEQQAGYSLLLKREDFLAVGWFDVSSKTAIGGEDALLCDYIKGRGKLIAAVDPPIIIHCGLVNWRGLPAADYPEMMRFSDAHPEIKFL